MKTGPGDVVWKALADPTRREILECLSAGATTTGDIVDRFAPDLVRTAVMKHLDVLEEARLIRIRRSGRFRWNHIERKPLGPVSSWLDEHIMGHAASLGQLKKLAEKRPGRTGKKTKANP